MAASDENTVSVVTQWPTWITDVEMHQALRQKLKHSNKQYHLPLADAYTDQLQHNHGEVTEVDHDMLPIIDSYMTAAEPNTADLDMAIMEKTEPTPTAQQVYQVDTSNDGIHQQGYPPTTTHSRNIHWAHTKLLRRRDPSMSNHV
jgi:hypothetical protein